MTEEDGRLLVEALLMAGERLGVAIARGHLRPSLRDELIVEAGEDTLELFSTFADELGVDVREVVVDYFERRLRRPRELDRAQS